MVSQLGEHALSLAKIGELLDVVYRREYVNKHATIMHYCIVHY